MWSTYIITVGGWAPRSLVFRLSEQFDSTLNTLQCRIVLNSRYIHVSLVLDKQINGPCCVIVTSSIKADVMRSFRFVCHSLYVCVQDYCKSNHPILLKLGVLIGPANWKNRLLTFVGDPVPDTDSGSLTIAEYGFLEDLLAFSCSRRPIFTILGEMTRTDRRVKSQHFGTDPTGIRIQIRINPKIRIRIPDQLLALAEFALSECFCFVLFSYCWINHRNTRAL